MTGKVLAETEAEVRFALGSGTRGIAYLIERDGFLFQSPLSWYAEPGRWDLAPGYKSDNRHFERTITPDCLFCHTNLVQPVAGMENRFETPFFHGLAIGCERCHGPGELHARRAPADTRLDRTIVNPANLDARLRESVCQQCHLMGALRFPRAGRKEFDFRPGLPLHRFIAVFLKRTGGPQEFESVGHVEQMQSSRCFLASDGKLGCTSCHDPHQLPSQGEKVAYYRERCLECHARNDCRLPAARGKAEPGNDCASCHMPRADIANIPHTAATDHRIRRTRAAGEKTPAERPTTGQPLVDFHTREMTESDRHAAARDLGVALSLAGWFLRTAPAQGRAAGELALPLLESALRDHPHDLPAREAPGAAQGLAGRSDEALHTFEHVLRIDPAREPALRSKALALGVLDRPAAERRAWEALLAVDPWRADDHVGLAKACSRVGNWTDAIAACRNALRLNPAKTEARALLIQYYLRAHEPAKARAELQALIGFNPAGREAWMEWFQRQKEATGPNGNPWVHQ